MKYQNPKHKLQINYIRKSQITNNKSQIKNNEQNYKFKTNQSINMKIQNPKHKISIIKNSQVYSLT